MNLCEFAITKLAEICEGLHKSQESHLNSIIGLQNVTTITTHTNGLIIKSLKEIVEKFSSKDIWKFTESKN